MSPDAVVLEAGFVRLFPESEALWRSLDETVLEGAHRNRLAENGIRMGVCRGPLPTELLADKQREQNDPLASLEQAGVASPLSKEAKRLQCTPGRVVHLSTRRPIEEKIELTIRNSGQDTTATLDRPEFLVAINTLDRDDNHVGVSVRSIVRHGVAKQTWVGQEQALRIGVQRPELDLEFLGTEIPLALGHSIIIGATDPPHGLGQQMWTAKRLNGAEDQTVLVIRVVAMQGPELKL